jgi:hypothetical protein
MVGNTLFNFTPSWVVLVAVWSLAWKAVALWMAARRNQKIWFGALLLVNLMGILEILYIFVFSKMKPSASHGMFTANEAKEVGDKLGITWDKWDVEQFRMGMDVELEHGKVNPITNVTNDDPILTGKIALAHLNEIRDYYTRLKEMEEVGESYWKGK